MTVILNPAGAGESWSGAGCDFRVLSDGSAPRLEGHGPVTEAWLKRLLGPAAHVKVQPVLDLAGQAHVDAYEKPERHRRAVHLMTPADTFPFASCTSRQMQVDHTIPYDQDGLSGVGNYGPMTTAHHRIKTHGGWQVWQPFPSVYVWRDPHGAFYLVDHSGTTRLRWAADSEAAIDWVWRRLRLEYDAA